MCLMSSCNRETGMPLQHAEGCRFKTPEALAQSLALSIKTEDFTCANSYLPGMASVFGMQSTNENDTAVADFGNKAEHVLVKALKEEIMQLRQNIAQKGGDIAQIKLKNMSQKEENGVTHITMYLSAGKLDFTLQPVGLFNNEGNWCLLGSRFTVGYQ